MHAGERILTAVSHISERYVRAVKEHPAFACISVAKQFVGLF